MNLFCQLTLTEWSFSKSTGFVTVEVLSEIYSSEQQNWDLSNKRSTFILIKWTCFGGQSKQSEGEVILKYVSNASLDHVWRTYKECRLSVKCGLGSVFFKKNVVLGLFNHKTNPTTAFSKKKKEKKKERKKKETPAASPASIPRFTNNPFCGSNMGRKWHWTRLDLLSFLPSKKKRY